ncbi:MAG: class I SAM-dependent methyltransferase [Acidobacteria bacterium]|nr:class I SAM-dependent methyltransferase [Acidobacteriota bacterium]
MPPLLKSLDTDLVALNRDRLPQTIAAKTRRFYDVISTIYPLSSYIFHARAHKVALEMAGVRDGMQVLEIATGSGEMFRKLVKANGSGKTYGIDISPRMAARTHKQVRQDFPKAKAHCHAVDARYLPFRPNSFDAVFCCYLLELLSRDDIILMLSEVHRVLRRNGSFSLILIGSNESAFFNGLYEVAGSIIPAFWGRQMQAEGAEILRAAGFHIQHEVLVKQSGYSSRVLQIVKD